MLLEPEEKRLLNTICEHMEDDYSKEFFEHRILYSLTQNELWIKKIINMTKEGRVFNDALDLYKDKEHIIFGSGAWGTTLIRTFPKYRWDYFVDNNKIVSEKMGIPVLDFKELCDKHRDSIIIISTRLYYKEIFQQLKDAGFYEDQILNMGKMINDMSKRQYFDLPFLSHCENEIFVDCGCFDGETSLLFNEWSDGNYKDIYAFEPDKDNYLKCKNKLENKLRNIKIFNCGNWNYKTTLQFNAVSSGASSVTETGKVKIEVEKLDDILLAGATFIKMDIEGSEAKALEGCRKTIEKYKPKCAISIYHKPEDIWEIPQILLEYNPNYKFYLRHYSVAADETVLYAVDC